ncbi:hypothetical protein TIFTF001_049644 [Ficus carica]|uniref:Uncharacterized protein n=1 Tax=Ficus carica TaxID=3494 RepID=A0AA87Z7B2_FICCA|nr:hypothetical protein TIFTF001_049644 [Ficus carica]
MEISENAPSTSFSFLLYLLPYSCTSCCSLALLVLRQPSFASHVEVRVLHFLITDRSNVVGGGLRGRGEATKKQYYRRNLFILAVEGLVLGRSVGRLPSPMGRMGLDLRRECTEATTTQSVRSAIRNPKKLGDGGVSTVEEEIRCKGGPSSPTTAWRRLSTAGLREFRSGEDISRALGGGGWALVGVLTVVGLGVVGVLASSPGFGGGAKGSTSGAGGGAWEVCCWCLGGCFRRGWGGERKRLEREWRYSGW